MQIGRICVLHMAFQTKKVTLPWMLSEETLFRIPTPKEASRTMSTRSISLEARERLRAQQAQEVDAVCAHAGARLHLQSALAKREQVIAAQNKLVAEAETGVAVAAAKVVSVSGFGRATAILGATPAALRRQVAVAKGRAAAASGTPRVAAQA